MKYIKKAENRIRSGFYGVKEGASLILCGALILISCALVSGISGSTSSDILAENVLDVNSSPSLESTPTVVLDPGHGGVDGGATGSGGILEKDLNLDIALMLRDMLVFNGYKVVMTRTDDSMHYDEGSNLSKKTQDTRYRVELTKQYENCIFVSIHMNKFVSEKYSGLQVYYSPNVDGGKELAQSIQSLTKQFIQPDNDRKVKKSDSTIYVLDKAVVPAVLVECGFLSNLAESERLCDREYRRSLASVIFMAIDSSLSGESVGK